MAVFSRRRRDRARALCCRCASTAACYILLSFSLPLYVCAPLSRPLARALSLTPFLPRVSARFLYRFISRSPRHSRTPRTRTHALARGDVLCVCCAALSLNASSGDTSSRAAQTRPVPLESLDCLSVVVRLSRLSLRARTPSENNRRRDTITALARARWLARCYDDGLCVCALLYICALAATPIRHWYCVLFLSRSFSRLLLLLSRTQRERWKRAAPRLAFFALRTSFFPSPSLSCTYTSQGRERDALARNGFSRLDIARREPHTLSLSLSLRVSLSSRAPALISRESL